MSYAASQAVSVRFAKFRNGGQIQDILLAELPGYGTLNQRVGSSILPRPTMFHDDLRLRHKSQFRALCLFCAPNIVGISIFFYRKDPDDFGKIPGFSGLFLCFLRILISVGSSILPWPTSHSLLGFERRLHQENSL